MCCREKSCCLLRAQLLPSDGPLPEASFLGETWPHCTEPPAAGLKPGSPLGHPYRGTRSTAGTCLSAATAFHHELLFLALSISRQELPVVLSLRMWWGTSSTLLNEAQPCLLGVGVVGSDTTTRFQSYSSRYPQLMWDHECSNTSCTLAGYRWFPLVPLLHCWVTAGQGHASAPETAAFPGCCDLIPDSTQLRPPPKTPATCSLEALMNCLTEQ